MSDNNVSELYLKEYVEGTGWVFNRSLIDGYFNTGIDLALGSNFDIESNGDINFIWKGQGSNNTLNKTDCTLLANSTASGMAAVTLNNAEKPYQENCRINTTGYESYFCYE